MPDVFDRIEWKVRDVFGEGPVCVHVGNVKECEIKRHPTYAKFRADAISAGVRSAASSRLWESLIAMGRLCDLEGDDTWRLVILDCIVPCFRFTSMRISRDFRVDREDLRSAMVATALEVWANTAVGVPPRHVRDRMVKAAFEVAWQLGNSSPSEYPTDDVEIYDGPDISGRYPSLKAASIVDMNIIRDADFAEQIRGERFGALFERLGHFEAVQSFHEEIRAGRRSGSVSQSKASGLHRYWISNPNNYYYASDLYPPYIGLREAASVMGIAESAARRLISTGQFPFPVARAGRSYKVSVRALMHFKDIPDAIVYVDDVENGALHVRGAA